jgi:hypothetical protein
MMGVSSSKPNTHSHPAVGGGAPTGGGAARSASSFHGGAVSHSNGVHMPSKKNGNTTTTAPAANATVAEKERPNMKSLLLERTVMEQSLQNKAKLLLQDQQREVEDQASHDIALITQKFEAQIQLLKDKQAKEIQSRLSEKNERLEQLKQEFIKITSFSSSPPAAPPAALKSAPSATAASASLAASSQKTNGTDVNQRASDDSSMNVDNPTLFLRDPYFERWCQSQLQLPPQVITATTIKELCELAFAKSKFLTANDWGRMRKDFKLKFESALRTIAAIPVPVSVSTTPIVPALPFGAPAHAAPQAGNGATHNGPQAAHNAAGNAPANHPNPNPTANLSMPVVKLRPRVESSLTDGDISDDGEAEAHPEITKRQLRHHSRRERHRKHH